MAKYEIRFDSGDQTHMVLELITDDGAGNRYWEIVGEYDTEYDASLCLRNLRQAEEIEIYAEFG